MRKLFLCALTFLLALGGLVLGTQDRAEALTFELNYIIEWQTGGYVNTPVIDVFGIPSFGTITLIDNGTGVDIVVDLIDTGTGPSHAIQQIDLNYDDDKFDSLTDDFDTVGLAGIIEDENAVKADGYLGFFDLSIPDPPPGNLGNEPYTDTIILTGYNLNPADFNFFETFDFYLAAVHIGNFGGEPGLGGDDSIWVGATVVPVPEPATMLLLGSGLAGLAAFRRKFRK